LIQLEFLVIVYNNATFIIEISDLGYLLALRQIIFAKNTGTEMDGRFINEFITL